MSWSNLKAPSYNRKGRSVGGKGDKEGEKMLTSVNFIPRIILSQGRTNTFTAVEKNRLKLLSVNESYTIRIERISFILAVKYVKGKLTL